MKVHRLAFLLAAVGIGGPLSLATGCAKAPTVIDVQVATDDTVPKVAVLRSTVARESDPSNVARLEVVSAAFSETDGNRTGEFQFPFPLRVMVPPGWSGPATLTVEGVDWDTGKVNATGTTSVTLVSQQTTTAMLKMTGVSIGSGGDGGVDAGSTNDADGSSDAAD